MPISCKINVFWFRRDLRLEDNTGLYHALNSGCPVLLLFIFDRNILDDLEDKFDLRVKFIHEQLKNLNRELRPYTTSVLTKYGFPLDIFKSLLVDYQVDTVYTNEDYEPYAISRDKTIKNYLDSQSITFKQYKDHVIFAKNEVLNENNEPYKVFSAYKKRWFKNMASVDPTPCGSESYLNNLYKSGKIKLIDLSKIGFLDKDFTFADKKVNLTIIKNYDKTRDFPCKNGTTRLGIHLRFGTISIRKAVDIGKRYNIIWLNELIWREFYSMILYHFPKVVTQSFKYKYDNIEWINDKTDFKLWKEGKTGYPIIDAGMRQLNQTGYMHNRVRMITASFLTKCLLIDWRWGESYFAQKLLDYDLASNNGGWQWAAGTGTDAQPYFRIFNPWEQTRKYDPAFLYIRKWVPEYSSKNYPETIIDYKFARLRAIERYKKALS